MSEMDIIRIIESDPWMMSALRTASGLGLRNWAIGGGFVRNKIWDLLHGVTRIGVATPDIDLVYFDPDGNDEVADAALSKVTSETTGLNWEIVNQCYAHAWNELPPHRSLEQAIASWPETATAIAVRLSENGRVEVIAPFGFDDLTNLVIRPTPAFADRPDFVRERATKKQWLERWPKLTTVIPSR